MALDSLLRNNFNWLLVDNLLGRFQRKFRNKVALDRSGYDLCCLTYALARV